MLFAACSVCHVVEDVKFYWLLRKTCFRLSTRVRLILFRRTLDVIKLSSFPEHVYRKRIFSKLGKLFHRLSIEKFIITLYATNIFPEMLEICSVSDTTFITAVVPRSLENMSIRWKKRVGDWFRSCRSALSNFPIRVSSAFERYRGMMRMRFNARGRRGTLVISLRTIPLVIPRDIWSQILACACCMSLSSTASNYPWKGGHARVTPEIGTQLSAFLTKSNMLRGSSWRLHVPVKSPDFYSKHNRFFSYPHFAEYSQGCQ